MILAKLTAVWPAPPTPGATQNNNLNWAPGSPRSGTEVTCKGCQTANLYWGWNFRTARPWLVDKYSMPHDCPTPQTRDVFPGWCDKCKAPDLFWFRKKDSLELTESYGLPHSCEQDKVIQDMSVAKCRHCTATDLFWVKVDTKFSMRHADGTKHTCPGYTPYMKDWAEAKRMEYALQKAWIKSHPDDAKCPKCKGNGYRDFLSKNKLTLKKYGSSEPITMHRHCKHCKRIGTFSKLMKAEYLKSLRKKFWPFWAGVHKWKKYDSPGQ